jgi:hypothetical protein
MQERVNEGGPNFQLSGHVYKCCKCRHSIGFVIRMACCSLELLAHFDVFLDQADVPLNLSQNIEKHKERSKVKKKRRKFLTRTAMCDFGGSPIDTRPIRLGFSFKTPTDTIVPFTIQSARCCSDPPILAVFSNVPFPLI